MFIYTFMNIYPGKKTEIEQLIMDANAKPFDHPMMPDAVCFRSNKPRTDQNIVALWARADGVSPSVKLRTESE
jgi:hypothetical protein